MLKKMLVWGLVIMVIATVINDVGRYFRTLYELDTYSRDVASNVVGLASGSEGRNQAGGAAVTMAAQRGYRLYGFDISEGAVLLWMEADVGGTWVAGPVSAFTKGERDLSRLWSIPLVVRVKTRALI